MEAGEVGNSRKFLSLQIGFESFQRMKPRTKNSIVFSFIVFLFLIRLGFKMNHSSKSPLWLLLATSLILLTRDVSAVRTYTDAKGDVFTLPDDKKRKDRRQRYGSSESLSFRNGE